MPGLAAQSSVNERDQKLNTSTNDAFLLHIWQWLKFAGFLRILFFFRQRGCLGVVRHAVGIAVNFSFYKAPQATYRSLGSLPVRINRRQHPHKMPLRTHCASRFVLRTVGGESSMSESFWQATKFRLVQAKIPKLGPQFPALFQSNCKPRNDNVLSPSITEYKKSTRVKGWKHSLGQPSYIIT